MKSIKLKDEFAINEEAVAHEIGHGVYKLQHTFDFDGLAEKKEQTDNVMDNNTSEPNDFLAHYQWRVMQDSVMFVWGLFQEDEDGMMGLCKYIWKYDNFLDNLEDEIENKVSIFDEFNDIDNKYSEVLRKGENKKKQFFDVDWTLTKGDGLEDVLASIAKETKVPFQICH